MLSPSTTMAERIPCDRLSRTNDVVFGRRFGLQQNAAYQAALDRWVDAYREVRPMYKEIVVDAILNELSEADIRFLVPCSPPSSSSSSSSGASRTGTKWYEVVRDREQIRARIMRTMRKKLAEPKRVDTTVLLPRAARVPSRPRHEANTGNDEATQSTTKTSYVSGATSGKTTSMASVFWIKNDDRSGTPSS